MKAVAATAADDFSREGAAAANRGSDAFSAAAAVAVAASTAAGVDCRRGAAALEGCEAAGAAC